MGLAVVTAAYFLIFFCVRFELSYDAFPTKSLRIYQLVTDVKTPGETIHADITAWPFAPNIKFSGSKSRLGKPCEKFAYRIMYHRNT